MAEKPLQVQGNKLSIDFKYRAVMVMHKESQETVVSRRIHEQTAILLTHPAQIYVDNVLSKNNTPSIGVLD